MDRKSCCSARSCCPSTRAMSTTPKKEPVVTIKTPKLEVVKPQPVNKVEDHQVMNAVKVEKTETGANIVSSVKKEEAVKVNVGCGGRGSCR